jgi:UDP-2,4-diacetamido-2,4,6-trideoxy-beta-L-altropyranose hydrolase
MRCATLARELVARGADVRFLCRTLPGDYCEWLESAGLPVTRLGRDAPAADDEVVQVRKTLGDGGDLDWLVVDHYGLDARWERAMRPLAKRIFVIDDRADRPHECDALLDQNYFMPAASDRYAGLVPKGARVLLGPRYALLAREFAMRRGSMRVRDGAVHRVMVCFGGADPRAHTLAAIEALRPYAARLDRIDIVLGRFSPHQKSVSEACKTLRNAVMHCPAPDIAELTGAADLAIGAGGTMNWERACLGVPTIAFGIADNQRPVLAPLIEAGYVAGIPEMSTPDASLIGAWLSSALSSPEFVRGLAYRSSMLVDGLGAERVAEALLPGMLEFRRATLEDSENLLRWRNHPAIRGASLDNREISRSTHEAWMARTLADPRCVLLVAQCQGEPVGVVRFDLSPPEATISVYRIPVVAGARGLIRQATEWLRAHRPEIRRITAEVLPDNGTSLAAFRNAGYRAAKNSLVIELDSP